MLSHETIREALSLSPNVSPYARHLWPISGEFNATERAIRRLQRLQREGLVIDDVYSYEACLEAEISRIVNGVNA